MGAAEFSDVDSNFEDSASQLDPAVSNRAAFIRDLVANSEEGRRLELQLAMDTFVLAGAVKLYRYSQDPRLSFRHHTMLVHESVRMAMHRDVMKDVQALWAESGYTTPAGIRRLRTIYEGDMARVSASRIEVGVPIVPSFDALKPYIGESVARIEEHAGNPVIVVNGDKDLQANQQHLDFDKGSVWRILIGGTKLSRGFTVEGLTVSYYRRITPCTTPLPRLAGGSASDTDIATLYACTSDGMKSSAPSVSTYSRHSTLSCRTRKSSEPSSGHTLNSWTGGPNAAH